MTIKVQWFVYILRCADESLYTGITSNLNRRLTAHNSGRGAKYTRGRGPHELVYSEACGDRSTASKREYAIKALSRKDKISLIQC